MVEWLGGDILIFSKGDRIIFDNHVREIVCCDEEVAILGMVVPLAEEDGESVSYESLAAVSNDEAFRDTIDFKFVGGKVEDGVLTIDKNKIDNLSKFIKNLRKPSLKFITP